MRTLAEERGSHTRDLFLYRKVVNCDNLFLNHTFDE